MNEERRTLVFLDCDLEDGTTVYCEIIVVANTNSLARKLARKEFAKRYPEYKGRKLHVWGFAGVSSFIDLFWKRERMYYFSIECPGKFKKFSYVQAISIEEAKKKIKKWLSPLYPIDQPVDSFIDEAKFVDKTCELEFFQEKPSDFMVKQQKLVSATYPIL